MKPTTSLLEQQGILVPRRSKQERQAKYLIVTQKRIQKYIRDGGQGDLDLSYAPITSLPNGLQVGGNLNLAKTPITSLPNGLQVGGNLNLAKTPITSLPNGLQVGGNLHLFSTAITSLPDGLKVGGWLDITNTPITSLPNGLQVGGNLFLQNTPITSLPDGLEVGRNLDLYNTPISKKYTKDQIRQMVPGVKGDILGALKTVQEQQGILIPRRSKEERQANYLIAIQKRVQKYIKDGGQGDLDLSSTPITSLPDGLKVGGNLNLYNTAITSLPDRLEVGDSLYLINTPITSLPDGLEVGRNLDLYNTPISKKYTKDQIRQMVPGVKGDILGALKTVQEQQGILKNARQGKIKKGLD